MDGRVKVELEALLRVIFGLSAPKKEDEEFRVTLPESLAFLRTDWLEDLIRNITQEILASFDLRRKTMDDDPKEIEKWKSPSIQGGWIERRKNHHLRIRTTIDDLFEKNRPLPDVLTCVRAWKLEVSDACADAIIKRFHIRPVIAGPWVGRREQMQKISQSVQETLAHKDLFLMTGRIAEAKAMEFTIKKAYLAMRELIEELEEHDLAKE